MAAELPPPVMIAAISVLMPAIMVVAGWFIRHQENKAKDDVKNTEMLMAQLNATNAAKEKIEAEFKAYRVMVEADIEAFRITIAKLVSQVHALELWVTKNNLTPPPKWEANNDSATQTSLGGK